MSDVIARTAETVLRSAENLHELVDRHGAGNDRMGKIADPVVEQLRAIGALGVYTPRELGGAEMTPRQAMDLFRTVSYADPATGWVTFALGFATGLAGAFLPADVAADLFSTPRAAFAGQGTRPGRAVPVDGGYLVSGDWSFASGIKHATHVLTAATDTGTGEARCFVLPVGEVDLIDNWTVLGLRGTGSIDYTLRDTFIPADHTFATTSTEPITGGSLYRIGVGNFASLNHGGWALGVGRRLLDEFTTGLQGKTVSDAVAEDYATAEAKLRSAKAFLYEVWEEIEGLLTRGDAPTIRLDTLNRLALNNAVWRVEEIAAFVYSGSGTRALRDGLVQRLFRDVHAGTQHITSSRTILQWAGRELAGLAEGQRWVHHSMK
ncbi:hypothetical protein [Amycolatopsis jejuensis]|uniref:hypothetical protein n=1 Tax=Amycolatopsis jejuensis TaxID=330084 RepID=UPI0005254A90|nr:hypothetical protein [Amycolatopsis jejuensis]